MFDEINQQDIITSQNCDEISRELFRNQTILYNKNKRLQDDLERITKTLGAKLNIECLNVFEREKQNLILLNEQLKKSLRQKKSSTKTKKSGDKTNNCKSKSELHDTIFELDRLIQKIRVNGKFEMKPQENYAADVIGSLTKKLEEEQKDNEESKETLRKLREDDEKYVLREKISDLKQLLTDLEVENTKLKYENEQLREDVENYKKQINEAMEESKKVAKNCSELEEEKYKLKQIISDLENEKIRIKKDMIEEMNDANRAKRVSIDTEIALQHISEAYEIKRKEVNKLSQQLEDAEKIIKEFKEQFEPVFN